MDRGYGSGYSGWGGGGPGGRGTHADSIIAKINERLDMLSQLEGSVKTERRYDHFESMDSRSSMASSRDLYRSGGYGFGADRGDNMLLAHRGGSGFGGGMGVGSGAGYDDFSSYGVAKMRPNMREPFGGGQGASSGGWASSNRHSPRRGGNTGGFGGHRGHSPGGGRGKLPSLLSNRMYPESGGFHQGPHDFSGRNFGGGPRAGRQRKRPLNKQVKQQPQKKKKKGPSEGDEPESKINKTESTGADSAAGGGSEPQDKNGHGDESKPAQGTAAADTAEKAEAKTEGGTPHNKGPSHHKQMKNRRGFIDRLMYTCSVCKLRCFYKEDLEAHLESRFHKDHFKYLQSQLTKPTVDFLQEYLMNKMKKTESRVCKLENHHSTICQVYKERDLTRELGLEHFIRKVEAAHCGACDLFIPMQNQLIQSHLKSADHNYNRKAMMEQSKKEGLCVARSILNHKDIGQKFESFLKGENPFINNPDEADDSIAMEVSATEVKAEAGIEARDGELAKTTPLEGLIPSDALEEAPLNLDPEAVQGEEQDTQEPTEVSQDFQPEEEGFEMGDEDYVAHDEHVLEGADIGEGLAVEEPAEDQADWPTEEPIEEAAEEAATESEQA